MLGDKWALLLKIASRSPHLAELIRLAMSPKVSHPNEGNERDRFGTRFIKNKLEYSKSDQQNELILNR